METTCIIRLFVIPPGTLQREIGELNDQIESLKKFQEEVGIHFLGKPKGQEDTIFKYTNIKASGSLCYLYLSNFERTEFDFKFSGKKFTSEFSLYKDWSPVSLYV